MPEDLPYRSTLSVERDVSTITYRVVRDLDRSDMPVGMIFKFWPWGTALGRCESPGPTILPIADVKAWDAAGRIQRVPLPRREPLVKKPAAPIAETIVADAAK